MEYGDLLEGVLSVKSPRYVQSQTAAHHRDSLHF